MLIQDLPAIPAFSFRIGGMPSAEFLHSWRRTSSSEVAPGGTIEHFRWSDPQTGLTVTAHLRRFDDFPALDWVLELENKGEVDTLVIEEILPLDLGLPLAAKERLRLHHANGSSCRKDDFMPLVSELTASSRQELNPLGGRSSNGVLPFMNLQMGNGGCILAVGWSGQWKVLFERSHTQLHLSAGMERTHLCLHPGEKIRTPRILLLPWQGINVEIGQNLLRRLLMAHYLPRIQGELVLPPVAQCLQGYFYLTGKAGEEFEMKALPQAASLGTEVYWIDACWYGGQGEWWQEVGSWEVNRKRFPDGLQPVSRAVHEKGMKFLVWFEPERCRREAVLAHEHPEFLLSCANDPDNLLLNLGDPAALAYISDLLSRRITEFGLDIYRQDFNFDPLPYWQAADPPDREGMSEIRYTEGLYALWDGLRERHPGLWIDNCSSGGRRIDLETLTRALPLWPSDFADVIGLSSGLDLHVGDQCLNAGLARWTPLFGGGVWNFTPYGVRGQMTGGFTLGFHIDHADFPAVDAAEAVPFAEVLSKGVTLLNERFPVEQARAAIGELKSIRPYILGDLHLLFPVTAEGQDWAGWQFHRADLNAGVCLVFRRHASPYMQAEVRMEWIDPQAEYEVSISPGFDRKPGQKLSGVDLAKLTLAIVEQPGSLLIRYRKLKRQA